MLRDSGIRYKSRQKNPDYSQVISHVLSIPPNHLGALTQILSIQQLILRLVN